MAVSLSLVRCLSSDADKHSFTVNYLINSCGLSPKSAKLVSKSVQFKTPDKPDLILSVSVKLGFSKPKISEIIVKFPRFLLLNPHKHILPKVEFFRSKGVSTPDLVKIFTVCPWFLCRTLENGLVRNFNFLVEVLQSEKQAIQVIILYPPFLNYSLKADGMIPNFNTLREYRVPAANISYLARWYWNTITGISPVKFAKIVGEVKEMGFNPLQILFVQAIAVLAGMTKSTRDGKFEVYKRWGWSDIDVITAFRKFPCCMAISEDKIMGVMDFYVNELGLKSSVIAYRPVLLGLSLKKRLIPRGAVIQFLCSKGLVESDSRITNMLKCTDKCFMEKYVNCHKEEAPHLIKLYNDKLHEEIGEGKQNLEDI